MFLSLYNQFNRRGVMVVTYPAVKEIEPAAEVDNYSIAQSINFNPS